MDAADRRRSGRAARRERIALIAFFAVAFVAVPLAVVALKGGSNLYSRVQRLWALHMSIQSIDPGRLAIHDPEADIAIVESFLAPSAGRRDRARAYFDQWSGNTDWSVFDMELREMRYDADETSAVVRYVLEMRRVMERRSVGYEDLWEKHDGVWYLKDRRETLEAEWKIPYRGVLRP